MPADSNPPGTNRATSDARRVASGSGRLPQDAPTPAASTAPRRALPAEPVQGGSTGMGSAVGWTVLGTLLPGLGLWRSGRRLTGSLVMAVVLLAVAGLAGAAFTQRSALVSLAANPDVLRGTALALVVIAVLWVLIIGGTHLALRPAGATTGQRLLGAVVVGGLSFAVAAPLAMGANVAYSASGLVSTVFTPEDDNKSETLPTITNKVDPWAEKDRLNVLVLGGDSGTGRSERLGMRTDTVIVASIDTKSGATTLFSLPRQTARMPFPKDSPLHKYYPNGFYDGSNPANAEYFLNAMYRNVPQRVPKDALGETKFFAEDVMKISVGEALGLDIDYFVTVNMDGFKDIINALGGITVNVNYRVPIGGKSDEGVPPTDWIEPGPDQHLGGRKALWYARGRYGLDDYSRMERQRCVINAVVQQASPANLLRNFEKVAAAGEKTVVTDVPSSMLPAMLELATRVQGTKLRSIVFINGKDGFRTGSPNWETVQKRVKTALKETAKSNQDPTTKPASPTGSATPSKGSSTKPTKSTKPKSDDLASECAYNPRD